MFRGGETEAEFHVEFFPLGFQQAYSQEIKDSIRLLLGPFLLRQEATVLLRQEATSYSGRSLQAHAPCGTTAGATTHITIFVNCARELCSAQPEQSYRTAWLWALVLGKTRDLEAFSLL